jgi:hypothetical protein
MKILPKNIRISLGGSNNRSGQRIEKKFERQMTNTKQPSQSARGFQQVAVKLLEEMITLPLLEKVARIRQIGAGEELVDLCLRKAEWPLSLNEIITALGSDTFRQVYVHLDPKVQQEIEVIITPPTLLQTATRKPRRESEVWQAREQIHKLKTESLTLGKTRTRRTWKEVTEELHKQDLLVDKTQDQIYWTLKDKRENPKLSPEDKQLLDEMFSRTDRGRIKKEVDEMADVIDVSRQRHSWEETQKILEEFCDWKGSLKQLMGAYARVRSEREKANAATGAETEEAKEKVEAVAAAPAKS